jgi:hypothetical protein
MEGQVGDYINSFFGNIWGARNYRGERYQNQEGKNGIRSHTWAFHDACSEELSNSYKVQTDNWERGIRSNEQLFKSDEFHEE